MMENRVFITAGGTGLVRLTVNGRQVFAYSGDITKGLALFAQEYLALPEALRLNAANQIELIIQ